MFLESIIVLLATTAVASFGAAAFIRPNILCIAASWVVAELLLVFYYVFGVALSHHTPEAVHSVARGVGIEVAFGAPFFLVAVTGFTFLARWIYRKNAR
jgi:hypothetical protein